MRIAESTWRVAEGSYLAFCSRVLSVEGKDQIGDKKEQSAHRRVVPRSSTTLPNGQGREDVLARERGRKTKTTKLMASGVGRHKVQLERVNPSLISTHSARESEWVKA
uniref:Uncharacterized protein n=1 Tax=Solanum tuberosum TaxID=4113 RepID=M1DMV8_SOLTU